ncbi:hypothetical protein [Sphingobium sp. WCS2017Hpa-17]|uniref:hypothetical protein n=1 Tax=Sphingobium sp. WCS2017Hpa-17 TaxID=3073638 RepID=UPI00288C29C7|nr:hypothetical protein [Sphingobium sp. WCS2017Hpa-17]
MNSPSLRQLDIFAQMVAAGGVTRCAANMGLGKIARGLGKVGLAIEGLGYIVAAGRALVRAVKGDPSDTEGRQNRWDQTPATDLREDSQVGPDAPTRANETPGPMSQ